MANQTKRVLLAPHNREGLLSLPVGEAKGLVLFAHGSGSSRLSPRNAMVSAVLWHAGLATLLFDLLTEAEAENRTNVFDIPLLAQRLGDAAQWARDIPSLGQLPLGVFGASTGAAAALLAASRRSDIRAVVSRGGRPDLAGAALAKVAAPTLLIVGGDDVVVLDFNREALNLMHCERRLEIVPGATHLFEEDGALESVAYLARHWFLRHLSGIAEVG